MHVKINFVLLLASFGILFQLELLYERTWMYDLHLIDFQSTEHLFSGLV